MTTNDECPSPDLLDQLAAGELPGKLESLLTRHIDQCVLCRETLDRQTGRHPLVGVLPDLQSRGIDSPLLKATLQKVKSQQDPWSPLRRETTRTDHEVTLESFTFSGDEFDQVQPVGRGGMGVVFKAREKSLNRMVAVKVLSPMLSADATLRERFLREARAAAAIKHPNVITIHAVADSSNLPYLVMEYVEGQSLQQRLDEQGTFTADEVIRIGRQIAAGLAAAHASGVVHRDVKPANILLESPSAHVKLSDFGLAQVAGQSSLTQTGVFVGTPAFIAPELLNEEGEHDHRADLFSLGSVMYAMLAGTSPFDTGSLLPTLHRISTAEPPPIDERVPGVPNRLASIIHRLLKKDPADRFQNAEDVVTSLRGPVTSHRPVAGRPPASVPPPLIQPHTDGKQMTRPTRAERQPLTKWILAVVCVNSLVIALTIMLYWQVTSRGAFVVLSDDGGSQEYPSLQRAIEEAGDGSRVEIHADGPVELPPTAVEQSELTIAAGIGFDPIIRFEPEFEETHDDEERDGTTAMITSWGDLMLEGVELRMVADEHHHEGLSLIRVSDGSFTAQRCHFWMESGGHCVTGETIAEVFLSGCDVHASDGTAINLTLEDHEEADVMMENCVITGAVGIQIEVVDACRLNLDQCTIIAPRAIEVMYDEPFKQDDRQLRISATQNLFATVDALVTLYDADSEPSSFSSALRWEGMSNVFSGPFVALANDGETRIPTWGRTLQGWQAVSLESDSRHAPRPLGVSADELWDFILHPGEINIRELSQRDDLRTVGESVGAHSEFPP